ncbi:MAG: hypothetical protein H7144_01545 [Burkholderiales bacterium]|nr:hypothetical protein [Phycisphaerae bacterium]
MHKLVWDHVGGKVAAGPFKGMKYIGESFYSAYMPKLLGIYEREVYPFIESAIAKKFPVILDIGAAEGYYACGMAIRCADSKIIAFEGEQEARKLNAQMAKINGVSDRIDIRGYCTRAEVKTILAETDRALLIVDCEGYEHILLDPLRSPDLAKATILVECHDFLVAGLTEELKERFAPTHDITQIMAIPRNASEFPKTTLYTRALGNARITHAVNEWRPVQMWWLWMTPRK